MKKIVTFCCFMMIGLTACGSQKESGQVVEESPNSLDSRLIQEEVAKLPSQGKNENKIKYEVDLTGDGKNETMIVDVSEARKDTMGMVAISVSDSKEKELWNYEIELNYMIGQSFYLCKMNGRYCVLEYIAYNAQGDGSYSLNAFYLGEEEEELIDEKTVKFKMYVSAEDGLQFPIDDMLSFAESANKYFSQGILLVGNMNGELRYSTEDNPVIYLEEYQYIIPGDIQRKEEDLEVRLEDTKKWILEKQEPENSLLEKYGK